MKKTFIAFLLVVILQGVTLGYSQNAKTLDDSMIERGLVDVTTLDPSIETHLIYATPYNFMGRVLYKNMKNAYLIPEAAQMLKKAAEYLREVRPDLHFVVYDAARPISIQKELWALVEGTDKEDFVANPYKGRGMHNYGAAIDLTLADCTGQPLAMGAEYDYFGDASRVDKEPKLIKDKVITKRELAHRKLLRDVMTKAGFRVEPSEWWHFNAFPSAETRERFNVID